VVVDAQGANAVPAGAAMLVVENTYAALGMLAGIYRRKTDIPVIAVGGSNGKTTTKDMISRVLSTTCNVLSTEGNNNNHVGVPQTLLRLTAHHDIAVVEVGTNHPGEIAALRDIVQPTHVLLTNIGREHLEFFGDLAGVAREERMARLYEVMRDAMRRGDWVRFGAAFDSLGAMLGRTPR
jgi:UDP-N-acetylmuramyl pentapeptide synthase